MKLTPVQQDRAAAILIGDVGALPAIGDKEEVAVSFCWVGRPGVPEIVEHERRRRIGPTVERLRP